MHHLDDGDERRDVCAGFERSIAQLHLHSVHGVEHAAFTASCLDVQLYSTQYTIPTPNCANNYNK